MALVETRIQLDELWNTDNKDSQYVDLSTKILDLKACTNYFVYEAEYKECARYYGHNPFRFDTLNLKGCFKHCVTWDIKKNPVDANDHFHISKLYCYNNIYYLTKDKVYTFFCISDNRIEEIRIPCPMDDMTKHTPELYEYIIEHPYILQDKVEEEEEEIKVVIKDIPKKNTRTKYVIVKPKKIKESVCVDDFF